MKNEKLKRLLDYLPFLILVIFFIILIVKIATTEYTFQWKHILGLILICINTLLFCYNHRAGVLFLCFVLLVGLLSFMSYDVRIRTMTYTLGKDENSQTPLFRGQPIFLLWLLLHFILSFRYYVGILSKKYWIQFKEELLNKS
ncbi:MAG: hypothetical protein QM725_03025 [Lacibacter sp.]